MANSTIMSNIKPTHHKYCINLNNDNISNYFDIHMSNPLGKGSGGAAYKAKFKSNIGDYNDDKINKLKELITKDDPNNEKFLAIKYIKNYNEFDINEINILMKISEENLKYNCKYYGCFYNKKIIYLIMELVEGVTLQKFLEKNNMDNFKFYYDYNIFYRKKKQNSFLNYIIKVLEIITQVAKAIEELHNVNITHNDIKLDNIMINDKDKLEIKLLDYGISCNLNDSLNNQKYCNLQNGTFNYIVDEFIHDNEAKVIYKTNLKEDIYIDMLKKKDWYSFGILLFNLLFFDTDLTDIEKLQDILNTKLSKDDRNKKRNELKKIYKNNIDKIEKLEEIEENEIKEKNNKKSFFFFSKKKENVNSQPSNDILDMQKISEILKKLRHVLRFLLLQNQVNIESETNTIKKNRINVEKLPSSCVKQMIFKLLDIEESRGEGDNKKENLCPKYKTPESFISTIKTDTGSESVLVTGGYRNIRKTRKTKQNKKTKKTKSNKKTKKT